MTPLTVTLREKALLAMAEGLDRAADDLLLLEHAARAADLVAEHVELAALHTRLMVLRDRVGAKAGTLADRPLLDRLREAV